MTSAIGLRPMHIRPAAGQHIIVHMKDGTQLPCSCTLVISDKGSGIIIYAQYAKRRMRKAIDEMQAKGWWPQ